MLLRRQRSALLLGPAFVASIAYVDPGNVAANMTAGAQYGFLLEWALVLACFIAMILQYQSAKLGLVTGASLPGILGQRLGFKARIAYWIQAEIVAAATDLAEVIGGAIALSLLFHVPLVLGGVIIGVVSLAVLSVQSRRSQGIFEIVITALLLVIVIGFMVGLVVNPPGAVDVLGGLIPRLHGSDTVLLAASMFGATVMPHVIYLHSTLVIDRHGIDHGHDRIRTLLKATRWDVGIALGLAAVVNVALLILAATNLRNRSGTDTIAGAHDAISSALGPIVGVIFGVGLLASSLASTAVGSYAGSAIMAGLLHKRIPLVARRLVVMIPALIILALGVEPTRALVISQVVLSLGIPFAMIPLIRYTASRELLGEYADSTLLRVVSMLATVAIVVLNVALVVLMVMGN